MVIEWVLCRGYDDAKDFSSVIYLHEWNAKPFYWGICDTTVFGGGQRDLDGVKRSPRYGFSYRHWIEGCLRHGGLLYVGECTHSGHITLRDVEATLIANHPSAMNDPADGKIVFEKIEHRGDVPLSIRLTDG